MQWQLRNENLEVGVTVSEAMLMEVENSYHE